MFTIESIFKAMGDPVRIQVIKMLAANGEMCVCRITSELNMTQPAVSHHLALLKNAGLVNAVKKGQWSYYSLCRETLSDAVLPFVLGLLSMLDSAPVDAEEDCALLESCKSVKLI